MKPLEFAMVATVVVRTVNAQIVREVDVDRSLISVGKHPCTNFNIYCKECEVDIVKKAYGIT